MKPKRRMAGVEIEEDYLRDAIRFMRMTSKWELGGARNSRREFLCHSVAPNDRDPERR